MGKKIWKLFLDTMLRAAVIVLGIGVVIMLALLIKSMVSNKSAKDEKTTENISEISTEAEDPDDPTFGQSEGQNADNNEGSSGEEKPAVTDSLNAKILVVNATGTSGVAGSWRTTLQGYGYTSVDVGNYSLGTITTTKVCVSGSYDGEDIAAYYTSPEMTTISTLQASAFDMPVGDYDIVVVVGTTDVQR